MKYELQTRKLTAAIGTMLLLCLSFSGVSTFGAGSSGLVEDYAALLREPGNPDKLYDYAQEAIRLGDYESAVGALEGILIVAGNQPRILVELANLYERFGAHRIAAAYLARARNYTAEEDELDDLAAYYQMLNDVTTLADRLRGYIVLGLRYQTNPTGASIEDEIFAGGRLISKPAERTEDADSNLFVSGRIQYHKPLKSTNVLVSDVIGYATKYDENSQYDLVVFDGTIGPEYQPSLGKARRLVVRPHAVGRLAMLDGEEHETTWGLGVDGDYGVNPNTRIGGQLQYRDREFEDDGLGFDHRRRTGDEWRADIKMRSEIKRGQVLGLRFYGRNVDGETGFLSFNEYTVSADYAFWIRNRLLGTHRKVSVTPYLVRRIRDYDEPEATVVPDISRQDKQWRFGIRGRLPFSDSWSADFKFELLDSDSNIPNYSIDNRQISIAVRKDF